MKKIFKSIIIIFTILLFTSCVDPEPYVFDYKELVNEIKTVELIDYKYDNPKIIKKFSEILQYNFELETVEKVLAEENKNDFLKELTSVGFFSEPFSMSNSACGLGIKLLYNNDDFIIMSCPERGKITYCFCVKFNSMREVIEVFTLSHKPNFINLANKYFNVNIG